MAIVWVDIEQGKSGNGGTSLGDAIRTMSDLAAIMSTLNPGDTVNFVPRRTPYQGYVNINRSGTSGNQIVFQSAPYGGDADMATLINPTQANSGGNNIMIFDVNASYVTFKGLRFADSWYAGIIQYQSKTGLIVQDCEFTRLGMGIRLKSGGFLIERCRFVDLDRMVANNNNSSDYGAVGITFEALTGDPIIGGTVTDCDFIRCMADSLYFGKDGGAFEFFRGSTGIIIKNCRVRRCKGVFELGGSTTSDTISGLKVYNVIAEDNYGVVWFFNNPAGGFAVSVSGLEIYHCMFDGRDRAVTLFFMDGLWGNLSSIISNKNNIWVGGAAQVFKMNSTNDANIATMVHQDNVIWRTDGNVSSGNIGFTLHASEIADDPDFVDRTGGNFTLAAGSPAIGIAQAITGYTHDHTGRAINSPADAGPLAYVTGTARPGAILQATPRAPLTDRSAFGVAYANDMIGGVHHFDTEAERNNLVTQRRIAGMIAAVRDKLSYLSRDLERWIPMFPTPPVQYEPAVCELAYVVASGTHGGNGTADAWSTRPLNTIERNFSDSRPANPNYTDVALASNQFTLTAGIYMVEARGVSNKTNAARMRVQNITDGITAKLSFPGWAPTANDGNSIFMIPRFYLSIKKTTVFELQQISDNLDGTNPTYQWGRAVGAVAGGDGNVETYARVQIERIR